MHPAGNRATGRDPHARVLLEPLEPRFLLSADLFPIDLGSSGDEVTLTFDGVDLLTASFESGAADLTRMVTDGTVVEVMGGDGDDTLTVDYGVEFFFDILFTGGGGNDSLVITGGSFDTVDYSATGPESGSVEITDDFTGGGATITYTGLEPVVDTSVAANRTFTGTDAGETIRLTDPDGAASGQSRIDDNGTGAFEAITFANPTVSLTIDGAGGDDTIFVALQDPDLTAPITLAGGAGDDVLTGGQRDDALVGGLGDDRYVFAGSWGSDSVAEQVGQGTDTLDFTGHADPLTVDADRSTIGDGASTVEQGAVRAAQAEVLDVALGAPLKTALDSGLSDLADLFARIEDGAGGVAELVNSLPLLPSGTADDSLARISQLRALFEDFRDDVGGLAPPSFAQLVTQIDGLALGTAVDALTLTATADYRGQGTSVGAASGALEVLVDLELDAAVTESFTLDLGEDARLVGLDFGSETIDVAASIEADLALGLDPGTPAFFLADGGTVELGVVATAILPALDLNLGFLDLQINGNNLTYQGNVRLSIDEPGVADGRITGAELTTTDLGTLLTVTVSGTDLDAQTSVTIPEGVTIGGVDLTNATFDLNLPSTDDIFAGIVPEVSLVSGVTDLLDFSNLGTSEVMGMIEELLNTLTSIAESEAMQVAVPFTDFTIGDLLDFAAVFRADVVDPLFASGSALEPDFNGDGDPDFAFDSIQELVTALSGALGIATAQFNPGAQTLRLQLDFNRTLGFGAAKVGVKQEGGGGNDEVQTVAINAVDSDNVLADTFRLGFTGADGGVELTDAIAYDAPADIASEAVAGESVQAKLEALAGIGPGDVAVVATDAGYEITFIGNLADTNVATLISDATQLKGEFPLDFGTELGDFAGVSTSADFSLAAALDLDLDFGIDLSPSTVIEITGPVFQPQNEADVLVSQPDGAAADDFTTQVVRVDNATLGSFVLSFDGNSTVALDYDISAADLETELEAVSGITDVDVTLETELGDRIFTVEFNNPSDPASLLAADANSLKGAADGILSGTASFAFTLINEEVTVATDGGPLVIAEEALGTFDVSVARETGNGSLADLVADIQAAVNAALVAAAGPAAEPVTLGFLDGGALSTGVLGVGTSDTADGDPLTTLHDDLRFTLNLVVDGEDEVVTGSLRVVDVLDDTPDDPDDQLDSAELAASVSADRLATVLQSTLNAALDKAGFSDYDVTVGTAGGRLTVELTAAPGAADTLELVFQSPVLVEGGGGRIALTAPDTKTSTHLLEPGVTAGHRLEIFADFADPAYQETGILSAPTRFDGVTGDDIRFTLEVDGTPVTVDLAAGDFGSVAGLAAALQAAVDSATGAAPLSLPAGAIEVFLVDDDGNRIGLRAAGDSGIAKLTLDVPELGNSDGDPVGAITELGFDSGDGQPQRSRAAGFFLEDVSLAGAITLDADNVEAIANLGFLEITASGSGGLSADASLDLRNPDDGGTRIDSDTLAAALADKRFLFDSAAQAAGDPTGFVDAGFAGALDIDLAVDPTGALEGLPGDLDASLQLSLRSPDWFTTVPTLADPLGLGSEPIALDGATVSTLGAAPDAALDDDVTFVVTKDGVSGDALGVIDAADTAGFTTAADYQVALQAAIDAALAELGGGTVTVGLDGGNLTLTGDAGIGLRAPFTFSGPDVDSILDQFRDLSFDDIIAGLRFVIDFLRSLDGSDGNDPVAEVLATRLPLLDRSVADLLDFASDLADRVDAIAANPEGSIQALEDALRESLGILSGQDHILSFDPDTGVLGIDFGFEASAGVARPFNLDLAQALSDAGAPAFLAEVVTANASGNLSGTAGVDLDLRFGLDLSGDDKALFLRTGADGTRFTAFAEAALGNPMFELGLGPFSVFSDGGVARVGGSFDVELVDTEGDPADQRLNLVVLADGVSINVPSASNVDISVSGDAEVNLPLFIGTVDNPISIDTDPGDDVTNALSLNVASLADLFNDVPGAFDVTLPDLDLFQSPPDLFLLLANPSLVVGGLDKVLRTLEEGLQGRILDFELPLVGDALADNPAANFINDFRSEFLQPLARTLVENNVTLGTVDDATGVGDGLIGLIQETLFDVFGPDGAFGATGLLQDSGMDGITVADIVHSGADLASILAEDFIQFDFTIGQTKVIELGDVDFDFGLPGLSIGADFTPRLTLEWMLDFGFGVDKNLGFYFVARNDPANPELSVDITLDLGSADPTLPVATANGELGFLALRLVDGVDVEGDSAHEFTELTLNGSVDLVEPNGDEKLTPAEIVVGPIGDIFQPTLSGNADIRVQATVDFSTLDPDLATVLPSVSTDILAHFGLDLTPADGLTIDPPAVAFLDVSLDVGSFISDFAGPILGDIGDVLDNVDWLIGPDGFLNKRIPLISDLAGKTITGKDLVELFDPENGPKVVAVLDAVDELFFIIDLITDAAAEADGASIVINFGDLVLTGSSFFNGLMLDGGKLIDDEINLGLSDLNANTIKNRDLSDLGTRSDPPMPKKTSRFVSGVTGEGALQFNLFEPETIFKLILGQPDITLFTYELPEFGFDFFYRQEFPIFGPLVATFGGGVSANFDFGFGYDTRGLQQFLATDNPAFLFNGFFLNDLDPATGFDRPEVTLNAQIAVGAAISIVVAKAGVEGGIEATIEFNLADLDHDGKIRFDEMAANLIANSSNPLAIFDIGGQIDFFMRAFLEINLFLFKISKEWEFVRETLFKFDIPFERPAIMASQSGDVLTLNIGDNAASRLNGDLRDIAETVLVKTNGPGEVVVWSNQFNVTEGIASINPFVGVRKIVAFGGAGGDTIDLSGVLDAGIEVEIHGGIGNDVITGGRGGDRLFGDAGRDTIRGGDGDDTIDGGLGDDFELAGQGGRDHILGGPGVDLLLGGADNDTLDGGPGDDTLDGGPGDDFYALASAGSLDIIDGGGDGLDILDFSDKFESISVFLRGGKALAGWGARTGGFSNPMNDIGLGDWLEDFEHMVATNSLADLAAVFGGIGADTFHVYETRDDTHVTLLDGKESNDTYIFHAEDGTPIDAFVSDNGNSWDLGNLIEYRGTPEEESILVTDSDITLLGGTSQVIRYESPAVDENLLQIKIKSGAGDDSIDVASTSITVPVKVFAGEGDDTITVGDSTVNRINAVSRPGLDQPFGLGPLVLIGGAGHDTVIVDDSEDPGAGDNGYLTAFLETRPGDLQVEVGVVDGLGMTLNELVSADIENDEFELPGAPLDLAYELAGPADTVFVDILDENDVLVNTIAGSGAAGANLVSFDGTDFGGVALDPGTYSYKIRAFQITSGRVEFEGFEGLDVRLGTGADGFRIGVDDVFERLPLNRQDRFDGFTHTIDGFTSVDGGGGADAIAIKATNTLDRTDLNTRLGIVSATTLNPGGPGNELQKISIGAEVGHFTLQYRFQETAPIAFGADAADVQAALEALFIIGTGNVDVSAVADGYEVEFVNDLGGIEVEPLIAEVTPLTILGGGGADELLVEAVNQDLFFEGGGQDDFAGLNIDVDTGLPLAASGVNAKVTLDGGADSDTFNVGLIGGVTNSLINVFDTGTAGTDVLVVEGTDENDLFLLRAAAAQSGLAFVAMLNDDPNFERVNYNTQLETINVVSKLGDDQFYIDDTRAAITIDAGAGDDFFQVGQLYKSERTTSQAGVAPEDVFATIETTRGFLSNGISVDMTINAGAGEDEFIVFHNRAVLTANGEAGDDRFLIQAFALVGSQDDERERTDVTGGDDADFIAYAVNAPVAINGGDGFDTVVVVGTEFNDDFVVTEDGVFGAGLNVNFVNVEEVELSGTEGDDRFFIQGTGAGFTTSIVGDLGSDTFFINGETPANGVISNDLLGHSGILTHGVESDTGSDYDGIKVVGISANVADNDEPAVIINQSNGDSQVVEGGDFDSYTVVLSRQPRDRAGMPTQVKVTALPPEGLVFVEADGTTEIRKDDGTPDGIELRFDAGNWDQAQTVRFKALADGEIEGDITAAIQHRVTTFEVVTEPVFETQDVVIQVPIFSFQPVFKTFNLGFFGSVTLLVGFQKVEIGSFPVVVGTEEVLVDEVPTEATVSDAFTGVIESAVGQKSDVTVDTTVDGDDDPAEDEVQTVTVRSSVDTFTLRFGLEDTDTLTFSSSADEVRDRLATLGGIGAGNVQVTRTVVDPDTVEFAVTFLGELAAIDVDQLLPRIGATLVDVEGAFPTAATDPSRPEGLRGAFVTIIDDLGNPDSVGQQRQILSNTTTELTLDQAWNSLPSDQARYEILQFNGLVIPTVEVVIQDGDLAALVVGESGSETVVAEGSASGSDTIEVSLSRAPELGEIVTVTLDGHGQMEFSHPVLEFNASNFDDVRTVTVTALDDGIVEGFHRADIDLVTSSDLPGSGFEGLARTVVADIGDNDHEGVLIIESDGSTDVVEGGDAAGFTGQGTDSYQVVLTKAPDADEIVTVTVTAQPTRTSRTGSIGGNPDSVRSFTEQLEVSLDGINYATSLEIAFDADGSAANRWDDAQTVFVRALDDATVDGGDSKVFAPILDLANNIQGPLFIEGGVGADRTGLFEREPVMLPVSANPEFAREVNLKDSLGEVLAATEETPTGDPATITIDPNDPDLLALFNAGNPSEIDLEDLNDLAIEITRGEGKNKVRFIENAEFDGEGNLLLTVNKAWDNALTTPGVPDATSEYTIFEANPNFFVVESEQVDLLVFNDTDNVTSFGDTEFGSGRMFFDDSFDFVGHRITGFGMGGDRVIGRQLQPGGVTYNALEVVTLNLGSGDTELEIEDTVRRDDGFQTWTIVNTGDGNDRVTVDIDAESDGNLAIAAGAGDDNIDGTGSTQTLVVFGEAGSDVITGGAGDDILFGDRGRVDYFDESGEIVTRLGFTPPAIVGQAEAGTETTLTDDDADFPPSDDGFNGLLGLKVAIVNGTGSEQSSRLIGANTDTTLTLAGEWDIIPDETSTYRISTTPENQTDGVRRGPTLVVSIDPEVGADDTIVAGAGDDIVLGGAGDDDLEGGSGDDQIVGDHARLDYVPLNDFGVVGPGIGDDAATQLNVAATFAGDTDGDDTISGADGMDIVLGGGGSDDIDARGADIAGDVIIGDHGRAEFDLEGRPLRVETTQPGNGGDDDITGGLGSNIILGGAGGDDILAGDDDAPDVILGDNGFVTFVNGIRQEVATRDPRAGGSDRITAGDGPNVLLGGTDGDVIDGGSADDIILGDHGRAVFDAAGVLELIETTDPDPADGGGADIIVGGEGRDIVLGGGDGDFIDARGEGIASDIVLGDHGRATFENGVPVRIETTDPDLGGADTIRGGAGANIILGGADGDDITAGGDDSPDIILGDNGFTQFVDGIRREIATSDPDSGGADNIVAGDGPNVLLGGSDADTITGGAAEDIVLGDNGQALFSDAGVLVFIQTVVSAAPNDSGSDLIRGGNGTDVVLGGSEGDTILAGGNDDARDIVLGDNGAATFTEAGVLVRVETRAEDRDGDDDITAGNGPDVVLGGTGNDIILAATAGDQADLDAVLALIAAGDFAAIDPGDGAADVILGDNGLANFTGTAVLLDIATTEPERGGMDLIVGGNGPDVILGGSDDDAIVAGGDDDAEDIVLGDNGRATFEDTEAFAHGEAVSILSFNFNAGSHDTTVTGEAGAGEARAGNWNNLVGDGPRTFGDDSGEVVHFDDGAVAPGITIEWGEDLDTDPDDLSDERHSQIRNPGTDDERLFEGYLETSTKHTVGVNVAGLGGHFETYDLYVYLDADNGDSRSGTSVRGISDGTTTFYLNDPDGNTFTGTYVEVTSTDPNAPETGNYVVFRGLTGDVASIRIDDDGTLLASSSNRPAITALQVVGQSNPIDRIESTDPLHGGDDIILTGGGADIAIGGSGADTIETFGPAVRGGVDADIVAGDNARGTFMLGELRRIETTFAGVGEGALSFDDDIRTGNGEDIVLGGDGDDTIDTGADDAAFALADLTVLGINFNSGVHEGTVDGVAGVVQAANWNNLDVDGHHHDDDDDDDDDDDWWWGKGKTDSAGGLVTDDGTLADGVTVEWGRDLDSRKSKDADSDRHGQFDPDTQNGRLFEGYLETSSSKTLGIDLRGLSGPFETYDLYVYLDADDGNSRSDSSVRRISDGTTSYYLDDADGNTFAGEFVETSSTDPLAPQAGNYVVFRGLTGDSASIRIDDVGHDGSNRPAVSAIQVVGGTDAARAAAVDRDANVFGGDFDTDAVTGDNGVARLFGGALYELETTEPAHGGDDTIRTGEDGDLVLGGSGSDTIDGERGDDLLLGDNARLLLFAGEVVGLDGQHDHGHDDDDHHHHHGKHHHKGFDPFHVQGITLLHEEVGGDDRLTGGSDDDLLYGQFGGDTYVFAGIDLGHDDIVEAGDHHHHDDDDYDDDDDDHDHQHHKHHHVHGPNDLHDRLDFSDYGRAIEIELDRAGTQDVDRDHHKHKHDHGHGLALTLFADDAIEHVVGTAFDDEIEGNDRNNLLIGLAGDDELEGERGDDILLGGDGNDDIEGGDGDDLIDGGAGDDRLRADSADDKEDDKNDPDRKGGIEIILGGAGNDDIKGSKDASLIDGEAGDDEIDGGSGDDVLLGGDGDDDIHGKGGRDVIEGGAGHDRIRADRNDAVDYDTGSDPLGLLERFQQFQASFFDFDGFFFVDPAGGDPDADDRPLRAWVAPFLEQASWPAGTMPLAAATMAAGAGGSDADTGGFQIYDEDWDAFLSPEESRWLELLDAGSGSGYAPEEVDIDPHGGDGEDAPVEIAEAGGSGGPAAPTLTTGIASGLVDWTNRFRDFRAW